MIVIPTGTDAPIYHWPYATVGMIVLNILAFLFVPPESMVGDEDEAVRAAAEARFKRFALTFGDGMHPAQWVTHNFLHLGPAHLAGNMLFLWAFGIVVEGKTGPLKYLLMFFLIGTLHGLIFQALMLQSEPDHYAAGASSIVYGLLAACMVWAPRNELNCLFIFFIGFRILTFHRELYFTTVALLYIGQQVFGVVVWGGLAGAPAMTEALHLSGAFWGACVSIALLKLGLVDCEGWDIFSRWTMRRELAKEWKKRGERLDRSQTSIRSSLKAQAKRKRDREGDLNAEDMTPQERSASAVQRVRKLIDKGDYAGAVDAYEIAARALMNWPSQPDLYELIKAFHARKAETESIRLMRDHCKHYPNASARVALKLAQILIKTERPAAALRALEAIPAAALTADLEAVRKKLSRQATQMYEDGVLELEEGE